jgi:hypothetical protein
MKTYKKGDKVMVEVDGAYGLPTFCEGTVVSRNGELCVHVGSFDSGIEIENKYDMDEQYVSLDEIID